MKKYLLLLILLLPVSVFGRSQYYGDYTDRYVNCDSGGWKPIFTFSTEVVYENGQYRLTNVIDNTTLNTFFSQNDSPYDILYSCTSHMGTECNEIYFYIKDSSCDSRTVNKGKIGIKLSNGEMYSAGRSFYVGKNYKKENGLYYLLDYEKHNFNEVNKYPFFSVDYVGYYICLNGYGITCDTLYKIVKSRNSAVGDFLETLVNVENYFLVSDTYMKENGKFKLIQPKIIYPATDVGEKGYTCLSHSDNCDILSTIEVTKYFDSHDGGRKSSINDLELLTEEKTEKIKENSSYDLKSFFSIDELSNVFSTRPEVADVKEGELEIYKSGDTSIIYEDDFNYKELKLRIVGSDKSNNNIVNPKTSTFIYSILVFLILVGSVTIVVFKNKKTSNF